MDDQTKNSIIDKYLVASAPIERECTICGTKYVGYRVICESKRCFWGLQARIAENRSMRPRDYVSGPRRTFLVEPLECKVCGKEYLNLEKHCKEINDDDHLVLLVHNA